jgi:hypothetical protein
VIKAPKHDTERALTEFLNDLVAVVHVIVIADDVLLLISVEPVIRCLVDATPLSTAREGRLFASPLLPLLDVEIVHFRNVEDLSFFIIGQVVLKCLSGIGSRQRELKLTVTVVCH